MSINGAREQITKAVLSWQGVEAHPHRFGGAEFRLGSWEIGHIHGDSLVDIPFPTRVRQEVIAAGQARPHHVLPESGWVSVYLHQPGDVEAAITLLQRSYQIARTQHARENPAEFPFCMIPCVQAKMIGAMDKETATFFLVQTRCATISAHVGAGRERGVM